MSNLPKLLLRVAVWAVVLGLIFTLIADFGEWDRFLYGLMLRVLFAAIGGLSGIVLNHFAGSYVAFGTRVFEGMGLTRFSEDRDQKILNSFIFTCALTGAILGAIFIR